MRRIAILSAAFMEMAGFSGSVVSADPVGGGSQPLKCESGPITRTFGRMQWLVYGCADGRSLVVVSAPGNPAMPFYFMFFLKNGRYELVGEGTGRKEATAAAFAELSALSDMQIKALVAEASQ